MSDDDRTMKPDDDRTRVVSAGRRSRPRFDEGRNGPGGGSRLASEDDWALPSAPAPPLNRAPVPFSAVSGPVPVLAQPSRFTASHANPVMQAAAPLMVTLANLRIALIGTKPADLMREIAGAIGESESAMRDAGVSAENARTAKYILCATADDIVQNLPGDQHAWLSNPMLSQFFGERDSGVQFFTVLDRLRQDPARNYPLLELQHACMALGFEGQYRSGRTGGTNALQSQQRALYETLRRVRRPERPLSPHWEGQPVAAYGGGFELPVWAVLGGLGVVLFAAYLAFRTLLGNAAGAVTALAATLQPGGDVAIERRVFAPPPPPPPPSAPQAQQLARVKTALATEIADGRVTVGHTADRFVVHLGSAGLFQSASAQIGASFATLGPRLATMLDKEAGPVRIVGHTDNSPLKTLRFPSNTELSLARANAVAAVLRKTLHDPNRLEVTGRGSDEPVATNDTVEGRAQNRRVDISFQRVD